MGPPTGAHGWRTRSPLIWVEACLSVLPEVRTTAADEGMPGKRVAVITGGASGIGEATARRLAKDGCAVAILDVNRAGGEAVAKSLSGHFATCDVADAAAVDAAAREVERELGPADILVTSAGLIPNTEAIMEIDMGAHARMWEVNYNGTLHACRAFARPMIARQPGAIVT